MLIVTDGIEREERLRSATISPEAPSFDWFCALIELESLYGRAGAGRNEVSLASSQVSFVEGTAHMVVLERLGTDELK